MSLTLQERLERIERRLEDLKNQFPDWRAWDSGYGAGNTPPEYYGVIRQLEDQRERLVLRISRRAKPMSRVPAPIRPVNTSGGLWLSSTPKASEVPHDPPMYYPPDLWPATNVILLNAQSKFPLQTQTLELCKHIISKMRPIFVEAVKAGKMKASAVQRENGGGMEDLLHYLLVRNDPGPQSGWGLSNQAYQLGEEARKSDEWLKLAEAIAEAQLLGTGEREAEHLHAQNSAKTVQTAENKSRATASAFTHSPDYRSVAVGSETFTLTSQQAQVIQILHEAVKQGTPEVGIEYILVQLAGDNRADSSRWQDTFKSNPKARKALVKSGRKGNLRLNL